MVLWSLGNEFKEPPVDCRYENYSFRIYRSILKILFDFQFQAFGFCEYAIPDAAARAIRILHDMLIGDKKLVVKVDAKTKDVLDEFRRQRRKKMTGKSPTDDSGDNDKDKDKPDDDFMDPKMRQEDQV